MARLPKLPALTFRTLIRRTSLLCLQSRLSPIAVPSPIARGSNTRVVMTQQPGLSLSRESGSTQGRLGGSRRPWPRSRNEAGLGLELAKRPEPRGEIDGRERYPAKGYRIADTLLADLEAAGHRVADIDSHIEEQSRAGEMG
jgi:hypothetical protein